MKNIQAENKKECCLCLVRAPLTREHKIKRSLLEYFNNLQNTDEDKILKFDNGTVAGGEFSNIKNARILTPKKNICAKCNSQRSAECDSYFDKFIIELFHQQESIPEMRILTSPSLEDISKNVLQQKKNIMNSATESPWFELHLFANSQYLITDKYQIYHHNYNELLIKKYLAKHTVCYFDRAQVKIPEKLRDIFLYGTNLDALNYKIYFLPRDFQYGYMNTMIKMPETELLYALIFSNLAIHVIIKK